MNKHPVILIGASTGGVSAMLTLAPELRPDFPAPILAVLHLGAHRSAMPRLMSGRGPNRAVAAEDGQTPSPGTIYFAPPDHHMLLEGGVIRLNRGPKVHHTRPAIDPLFRSAAIDCGSSAIGVILTGTLDDGSAGLRAIKDCGGTAVVQDPDEAREPGMPQSALQAVQVDHITPLSSLSALLLCLASKPQPAVRGQAPEALVVEHQIFKGTAGMQELRRIAQPSVFTCPDCGGVLFEIDDRGLVRFICHTGHAFSLRSLASAHEEVSDSAVWAGLRALQEKLAILQRLSAVREAVAPVPGLAQEEEALAHACGALRALTQRLPGASALDSDG